MGLRDRTCLLHRPARLHGCYRARCQFLRLRPTGESRRGYVILSRDFRTDHPVSTFGEVALLASGQASRGRVDGVTLFSAEIFARTTPSLPLILLANESVDRIELALVRMALIIASSPSRDMTVEFQCQCHSPTESTFGEVALLASGDGLRGRVGGVTALFADRFTRTTP